MQELLLRRQKKFAARGQEFKFHHLHHIILFKDENGKQLQLFV